MPKWEPALVRFWRKVDVTVDGCWLWTANGGRLGYGQFWTGERQVAAHRFSYEIVYGEIPAGLVLDHLCRNPPCVRPDHLEAVAQRVNLERGVRWGLPFGPAAENVLKTHCPHGHPYDEANTYINPRGSRVCRACAAARIAARPKKGPPARRTHCPTGHPYDEANTYVYPSGQRQCRACVALLKERKRVSA